VDGALEKIRALEEELEVLRREQSKLHRGLFEAAQIQRRLCAPRQFSSSDFEVAGEIFPVRHLSGDFFKVLELDSALGIVVGDIAGKGLSAGIWLPHLISLIHRCARAHRNPADAIAQAIASSVGIRRATAGRKCFSRESTCRTARLFIATQACRHP